MAVSLFAATARADVVSSLGNVTQAAANEVQGVADAAASTVNELVEPVVSNTPAPEPAEIVAGATDAIAPAAVEPVAEAVAPVADSVAPVVEAAAPLVEPVAPLVEAVAPLVDSVGPLVEAVAPVAANDEAAGTPNDGIGGTSVGAPTVVAGSPAAPGYPPAGSGDPSPTLPGSGMPEPVPGQSGLPAGGPSIAPSQPPPETTSAPARFSDVPGRTHSDDEAIAGGAAAAMSLPPAQLLAVAVGIVLLVGATALAYGASASSGGVDLAVASPAAMPRPPPGPLVLPCSELVRTPLLWASIERPG
jgi:hypothetical protein